MQDTKEHSEKDWSRKSTLLTVLHDESATMAFREFLQSIYASETLDFWLSVESFHKLDVTNQKQCKLEALRIYYEHFRRGAKREVNVPDSIRQQILSAMGPLLARVSSSSSTAVQPQVDDVDHTISLDMFDAAQEWALELMSKDSWRMFLLALEEQENESYVGSPMKESFMGSPVKESLMESPTKDSPMGSTKSKKRDRRRWQSITKLFLGQVS